jgi:hypothetical protein
VKLQFKKRRLIPVALAILVLVVGSGVAYAYWSSAGSGPGSAGVGTSQALTVTQTLPLPSNLVPGGAAQNVTVHIVNPATFSQSLSAVAITVHAATLPALCQAGWFTVTNPTIALPIVLATTTSTDQVGTIKLIESGTNQDGCKGATIQLDFAVS